MRKLVLLLLFASLCFKLHAQMQVSLQIIVEQKGQSERTWKTEYGSYRDEWVFQRTLKIGTLAVGNGDQHALMQWYFIGVQTANGRPAIISSGRREITLGRGAYNISIATSEVIAGSDTKYVALDLTDRRGLRPEGWVVQIFTASGKLLAEQGSTPDRLKWLKAQPPFEENKK